MDAWIERLRKRQPLEEDELQLLCRIVKDVLFQEPNVVVCLLTAILMNSAFHLQLACVVTFMGSFTI